MKFYQLIDQLDTLIRAWAKHPRLIVTYLAQLNYQLAKHTGNDIVYRNCLTTLGWTYFMQNKLQLARYYYQKALYLYELRSKPKEIIGSIRLKLGEISEREGNDEKAIAVYNTVLVLAQEISNLQLEGDAKIGLGRIYYARGKINEAFILYKDALKLSKEINDPRGKETALGNLGLIYHFLGDLDQAAECHRQAVAISQDIDHKSATGRHFNHLGNILLEQGKLSDAEGCFQKALTVARKAKDPLTKQQSLGNFGNLQQAYAQRAVEQRSKKDWLTKAEKHHKAALKIANNLGQSQDQAKHYTNLGRVYYEQGYFEKAREYYKKALALAKDQNLDDTLWRIHAYMGNLNAAQQQNKLAFEQYKIAINYVEEQRKRLNTPQYTTMFWQEKMKVYKDMVLCCLNLGRLQDGLEYTEKAKARYLTDLLKNPPGSSDDISCIIHATLQALSPHTAVVVFNITESGTVVFIVAKDLSTPTKDLAQPDHGWKVSSDGQIWARLIDTFKHRDLQQMLVQLNRQGEITGGYLGDYYFYRECLKNKDCRNNKTLLKSLQDSWNNSLEIVSAKIYEDLLSSVDRCLSQLSVEQVVFMPNLGLSLLPLHASYQVINNTERNYFLDHYKEITYVPNFFIFHYCQQQRTLKPSASLKLLAVADPSANLPWAKVEVESIAQFFNPIKKLDDGSTQPATIEAFKNNIHEYPFVHFACHGEFDLINPLHSALSLVSKEKITLEYILNNMELSNIHLVVMSACETGMIDPTDLADEYISLPAGFLLAGAPGVISTLWAVDDLSTALLMERFYQFHLQDKLPPAAALRKAQLWLRDEITQEEVIDIKRKAVPYLEKAVANLKQKVERAQTGDLLLYLELERKRRRLESILDILLEELRTFDGKASDRPFPHSYYWAAFSFTGA